MTCSKTNISRLAGVIERAKSRPPGSFIYADVDPNREAARMAETACGPNAQLVMSDQAAGLVYHLDWDTHFFGFPCAKADRVYAYGDNHERYESAAKMIGGLKNWCESNRVRFLCTKVEGPDPVLVQAFEHHGFYVVDNGLALSRPRSTPPDSPELPEGYRFTESVSDPLAASEAFLELFYDGRFHNDHRMPKQNADRLWAMAVKSQLSGLARDVLLIEHEDGPVGLATVSPTFEDRPDGGPGTLFILGLLPDHRGKGLGRAVLAEGLRRFQGRYSRIDVETSTFNRPAVKLYQSLGFEPGNVKISLHHWKT